MKVLFCGTRGSLPAPSSLARKFSTARYGGHTTCLHLSTADGLRVNIDSGSGASVLGDRLLFESGFGKIPLQLIWFFTHTHWDHIQGFPFHAPVFFPGTNICFFGSQKSARMDVEVSLESVMDQQQNFLNFPVTRAQMPAKMDFTSLKGGDRVLLSSFDDFAVITSDAAPPDPLPESGLFVESVALHHPGGALGYRFRELKGGASFAFITDNEPDPATDQRLERFLAGCDVVAMDGQYTEDEYAGVKPPPRKGWGHSTPPRCIDLAVKAGVRHLIVTHHEPKHDDAFLDAMLTDAHRHLRERHPGRDLALSFAYDALEIELPQAGAPLKELSTQAP